MDSGIIGLAIIISKNSLKKYMLTGYCHAQNYCESCRLSQIMVKDIPRDPVTGTFQILFSNGSISNSKESSNKESCNRDSPHEKIPESQKKKVVTTVFRQYSFD